MKKSGIEISRDGKIGSTGGSKIGSESEISSGGCLEKGS